MKKQSPSKETKFKEPKGNFRYEKYNNQKNQKQKTLNGQAQQQNGEREKNR